VNKHGEDGQTSDPIEGRNRPTQGCLLCIEI
jgi:hypothetical protein